jgi:hypothetical protein
VSPVFVFARNQFAANARRPTATDICDRAEASMSVMVVVFFRLDYYRIIIGLIDICLDVFFSMLTHADEVKNAKARFHCRVADPCPSCRAGDIRIL